MLEALAKRFIIYPWPCLSWCFKIKKKTFGAWLLQQKRPHWISGKSFNKFYEKIRHFWPKPWWIIPYHSGRDPRIKTCWKGRNFRQEITTNFHGCSADSPNVFSTFNEHRKNHELLVSSVLKLRVCVYIYIYIYLFIDWFIFMYLQTADPFSHFDALPRRHLKRR